MYVDVSFLLLCFLYCLRGVVEKKFVNLRILHVLLVQKRRNGIVDHDVSRRRYVMFRRRSRCVRVFVLLKSENSTSTMTHLADGVPLKFFAVPP